MQDLRTQQDLGEYDKQSGVVRVLAGEESSEFVEWQMAIDEHGVARLQRTADDEFKCTVAFDASSYESGAVTTNIINEAGVNDDEPHEPFLDPFEDDEHELETLDEPLLSRDVIYGHSRVLLVHIKRASGEAVLMTCLAGANGQLYVSSVAATTDFDFVASKRDSGETALCLRDLADDEMVAQTGPIGVAFSQFSRNLQTAMYNWLTSLHIDDQIARFAQNLLDAEKSAAELSDLQRLSSFLTDTPNRQAKKQ